MTAESVKTTAKSEFCKAVADRTLVRSQTVVSRNVAGETLIVPVRGKVGDLASIYSMNETGSFIWRLLERPRTVREIVAEMVREFAVTPEQAEKDATRFLNEVFLVDLAEVSAGSAETEGPVGRAGLAAAGTR